MSAHAAAWAARRESSGPEGSREQPSARRSPSGRGRLRASAGRSQAGSGGRAPAAPQPMGGPAGRGGAEGALRPAPLARSPKETHPWPPQRVPPPATPVALQRPTPETGAPALPTTLPASCASPKNRELTPSVQFLPARQGQQPTNVQGGTFISPVHSQQDVRHRKYYTDTSSS